MPIEYVPHKELTPKQRKFLEHHKNARTKFYKCCSYTIEKVLKFDAYNSDQGSVINTNIKFYVKNDR